MDQSPGCRRFLDFLDEQTRDVDADDAVVSTETANVDLDPADHDVDGLESEPTGSVFKQIKEKMIALQLRLSETETDLDLTRQALAKTRAQVRDQIDAIQHDCAEQIRRQREQFESALQRQMLFSKKVLDEKEALARKIDELIQAANQREMQLTAQIADLKEQEQRKIQKVKGAAKVAEKARRDRLIEEMRATIKEDTVRALEPELQRLIDQHNDERRRLIDERDQALRQQTDAHQIALQQLREQLQTEYQHQIEQERLMARDRLDRAVQDQHWVVDQARRRYDQELDEERKRIALERGEEKRMFEQALKRMKQRLETKTTAAEGVRDSIEELHFGGDFWKFNSGECSG